MLGHFYLGFSPDKKNNEINHSQGVSVVFLDPDLKNSGGAI